MSTPQTVYLNGELLSMSQAGLSASDYGFLYGHGLFETMRAHEGKVFRLQRHLARLAGGAQELGIPLPGGIEGLEEAVHRTLAANGLPSARIRLTVTAGEGEAGPFSPADRGPTVLVTAAPLPPRTAEGYERGYKLAISSVRRSSLSPIARLKSTNLIEMVLARREAQEKGADEALLLNEKRCITECAAANIFLVAYGRLITPSLDCGLLPGITREAIIEQALERGLSVEERWVAAEEIWDAEELFATSSIIGVLPVTAVNGRPLHGGSPGKITRAQTMAYEELVRQELSGAAPGPGSG